jgi:hypothetical protein
MRRSMTALLGAWLVAGCSTPGLLYTDITLPLTLDMDGTPRAPDAAKTIQRSVREPMAGIRAEWADSAPGEQARIGGMDSVSYADVHRHSLIGGIWGSTTVVVYGERDAAPASAAAAGAEAPQARRSP